MQIPDALNDAEVHHRPGYLKALQANKKTSLPSTSGSLVLKGSKRANALVGNISSRQITSGIGRGSKDLHRSLSLPGRNASNSPLTTSVSEPENSQLGSFTYMTDSAQGQDRVRRFKEISQAAKTHTSTSKQTLPKRSVEDSNCGTGYIYSEASNGSTGDTSDNRIGSSRYGSMQWHSAYSQVVDGSPILENSIDSVPGSSREDSRSGYSRLSAGSGTRGEGPSVGGPSTTSSSHGESISSSSASMPRFSSSLLSHRSSAASASTASYSSTLPLHHRDLQSMDSTSLCDYNASFASALASRNQSQYATSSNAVGRHSNQSIFSPDKGVVTTIAVSDNNRSPPSHIKEESATLAPAEEEEDQLLPSMCFTTDDRISSITATPCGSYVIVGYPSGVIKLYEMLRSGNTDLEDRYGYLLGQLASSGVQGSLRLNVEAGRCEIPPSHPGKKSTYVTHVFAGATLGSTTVFIVDIQSLHRLKYKRGFITMAGGGAKTFSYTDIRLRGFGSLAAVQHSYSPMLVPNALADNLTAAETRPCRLCGDEKGYRAIYRLMSGRGYGVYTVWEVELTSQVVCPICSVMETVDISLSGTSGAPCRPVDGQEVTYKYGQSWQILLTGNVNAPSMEFCRVFISPSVTNVLSLTGETRDMSGGKCSVKGISEGAFLEYITQGGDKDAKIHQIACCTMSQVSENCDTTVEECLFECVKAGRLSSKPRTLKGLNHIHAVSTDGSVFFGGQEELVVYRMSRNQDSQTSPGQLDIREILTFSLTDLTPTPDDNPSIAKSGASKWANGAPSRRGGRHLRIIEEVTCSDGQYAIIRCSDNAVVVYSLIDIFGAGCRPVRTEMRSSSGAVDSLYDADNLITSENTLHEAWNNPDRAWPHGFVTLLYHADDNEYGLKLSMSYVIDDFEPLSTPSSIDEWKLDVQRWEARHNGLRHPSTVLLLTSWWPLVKSQGKEGVLRAERLCPISSSSRSSDGQMLHAGITSFNCRGCAIPIAKADVGCASAAAAGDQKLCWLCGSSSEVHWPDLPQGGEEDLSQQEQGMQHDEGRGSDQEDDSGRGVLDMNDDGEDDEAFEDLVAKKRSRPDAMSSSNAKRKQSGGGYVVDLEDGLDRTEKLVKSNQRGAKKNSTTNDVNRQLQKLNGALEAEINSYKEMLKMKEKECAILVRKFDKRFAKEMESRRSWNADKRLLESKITTLEGHNALLEARSVEAESKFKMLEHTLSKMRSLFSVMDDASGSAATMELGFASVGTNELPSATCIVDASGSASAGQPGNSLSSIGPPSTSHFCVVCQANTANTLIISCGHLCLCYEHAVTMEAQGRLTKCPLCSKPVAGICRAIGVN